MPVRSPKVIWGLSARIMDSVRDKLEWENEAYAPLLDTTP
jgi:hypothetical protein